MGTREPELDLDMCIEAVRDAGYAVVDEEVLQEVYDWLGEIMDRARCILEGEEDDDIWPAAQSIIGLAKAARDLLAETEEVHD